MARRPKVHLKPAPVCENARQYRNRGIEHPDVRGVVDSRGVLRCGVCGGRMIERVEDAQVRFLPKWTGGSA